MTEDPSSDRGNERLLEYIDNIALCRNMHRRSFVSAQAKWIRLRRQAAIDSLTEEKVLCIELLLGLDAESLASWLKRTRPNTNPFLDINAHSLEQIRKTLEDNPPNADR